MFIEEKVGQAAPGRIAKRPGGFDGQKFPDPGYRLGPVFKVLVIQRSSQPFFHPGQKGRQHVGFGDHQAVIVPVIRRLADQALVSRSKFMAGGAEIGGAGKRSVVAQAPPVDAGIALTQGMEQAAHRAFFRARQAQERAMVKILYGLFLPFDSKEGIPGKMINGFDGSRNLGKPPGSVLKHPGHGFPGDIFDVIKAAARSAGNRGADLAEVNSPCCLAIQINRIRGCWVVVIFDVRHGRYI